MNDKIKRPEFLKIPCGKALEHGKRCEDGNLCNQCEYIIILEMNLVTYKQLLNLKDEIISAKDEIIEVLKS